MKKIYRTLFAAVAVLGMMCSCEKTPQNKPGDDPDDKPEEPKELIVIDGDFSDWSTANGVVSTEIGEVSYYPGLLAMKAVADDTNIYVYFEYELAEEQGGAAPFEVFVNADNNPATAGGTWLWGESGYEYMLESEAGFLDGNSIKNMDDLAVYAFTGEDGHDAFETDPASLDKKDVKDFSENAGKVSNGVATVELSFLRSVVNANKAGKLSLGIVAYAASWATTGVLPQGESVGVEPLMEITLP